MVYGFGSEVVHFEFVRVGPIKPVNHTDLHVHKGIGDSKDIGFQGSVQLPKS